LTSPLKIPVAEKWNQGWEGNLACGRVQGSEKSQEVRPEESKKKPVGGHHNTDIAKEKKSSQSTEQKEQLAPATTAACIPSCR
jgi:hypothetical protein